MLLGERLDLGIVREEIVQSAVHVQPRDDGLPDVHPRPVLEAAAVGRKAHDQMGGVVPRRSGRVDGGLEVAHDRHADGRAVQHLAGIATGTGGIHDV